jgi:hypothetical protein
MKALKFRKRTDLGHYSMYVRGFVLDNIAEVSQISRNGQIPQEWAELGGWSGARKNPPEEFWRTLVADRGKDDKNPPVYYSRACKESFKKGGFRGGAVNTTELINFERNSVVAQFCRRVQAVTWNRALVKTEKGQRLGLVNKNVEKGDRVCILYGCSVPVILRQSKHKTDAQFNEEMEWELRFLAGTLCQYYRQYRERVRKHGQRKAEAKERYAIWDLQKLKMWQRDQEWRRRWRQKLMLEGEDERNEGLDIKRLYEIPDVSELEKTSQAYRKHLQHLIWNQDLRLGREFNAWKREKRVSAKNLVHSDWVGPPVLNWREFELRLKYGRLWKKTITDRKEAIRKRVEAEWRNQTRKPNRPSRTAAKSALTNHHSPPMQDSEILNASSLGTDVFTQPPNGIGKKAAPPIPPPKMKQSGHVYLPGYVNGNLPSPLPKKHLSPSEASEYDQKIRRNFKARLGEDGLYSYELLGESYIHGMMDGEAMAYQNKEGIKTTVFELR